MEIGMEIHCNDEEQLANLVQRFVMLGVTFKALPGDAGRWIIYLTGGY